jgi:hypothetical protein
MSNKFRSAYFRHAQICTHDPRLTTHDSLPNKENPESNLEHLLLNGPVATAKELEAIAKNRKKINQWR